MQNSILNGETKYDSPWNSLKYLFIDWFSDTVEAYESGLLAKLLGIEKKDYDDLWIRLSITETLLRFLDCVLWQYEIFTYKGDDKITFWHS